MRCINQITIEGFLAAAPTYVDADCPRISFRMASSWPKRNGGDRVTWVNVVAFDSLAKAMRGHLSRGSRVLVQGRLNSSQYDTDQGRRERYEVVASSVRAISSFRDMAQQGVAPAAEPSTQGDSPIDPDADFLEALADAFEGDESMSDSDDQSEDN